MAPYGLPVMVYNVYHMRSSLPLKTFVVFDPSQGLDEWAEMHRTATSASAHLLMKPVEQRHIQLVLSEQLKKILNEGDVRVEKAGMLILYLKWQSILKPRKKLNCY